METEATEGAELQDLSNKTEAATAAVRASNWTCLDFHRSVPSVVTCLLLTITIAIIMVIIMYHLLVFIDSLNHDICIL